MLGKRTIGTCSICGGAVVTPDIWGAITPPIPECSSCGAIPRQAYGPVIDMQRPAPPSSWYSSVEPYIQSTGTSTNLVFPRKD